VQENVALGGATWSEIHYMTVASQR
jgi:hypothetical protein